MIEIVQKQSEKYSKGTLMLRKIWKESGYTTKEMAEITGYSYQTIKSWVQGRRNAPMDKVKDIERKLREYEKQKRKDPRVITSE